MGNGTTQILANLTCNPQACTSLVLKSSLLSWIEMQVGDSPGKESMAWLRILENVLVVADTSKLSRATGDQWCSTVCRCLSSLLRNKGTIYPYIAPRKSLTVTLIFSRQGDGYPAAERRGHSAAQSDPRHTWPRSLWCPLTHCRVLAAPRTCDPPLSITTPSRAKPPCVTPTTTSRAGSTRRTEDGGTALELGGDRGEALAGCHVSGR